MKIQCLNLLFFFIHLCMSLALYDDNIVIIVLADTNNIIIHEDNPLIKLITELLKKRITGKKPYQIKVRR